MFGIEVVPALFISRINIETTYSVNVLLKVSSIEFPILQKKGTEREREN